MLILDAWAANPGLHRYYGLPGFHHVRTMANHYTQRDTL